MDIQTCKMKSFAVIGKEGSTEDGPDFVKKLWEDANHHFREVEPIAKKDANGEILGFWGAMSDCTRSFKPWEEDFSKGLYLAGIEAVNDASAPDGWVKWTIPAYEYICAKNEDKTTFSKVLQYMEEHDLELAGAVHDFFCPQAGHSYLFFPIRRL